MTSLGSHFYFPPSRLKFIATVQSQIENGRVVAVEGATGTGKTVILEEVLTSALPNANKCYVTAGKQINDIQFRSRIIEQLFGNVLFDPEKPLLTSFLEFNQHTELLIVVDNAHYLSGQIIGELLQLYSELNRAGIILGIVVSFDKTISTTLMNVNSSILSINELPLLSFEESYQLLKEYIEDLPASSNGKVKRWVENAKGIPIQLLAYDQDSDLVVTSYNSFNVKLWGAVVVAFSVVLALLIHGYNLGYFDSEPETEAASQPEAVVKPWNKTSRLDENEVKPYQVSESNAKPAVAIETASPEEILAVIEGLDSQSPRPTEEKNTNKIELTTPTQSDNVIVEPLPELQLEPAQIASTRAQPAPIEERTTAPVEPNSSNSDQISAKQSNSLYKIDNSAFFSLPSDQFVLQLTAVSTEATLVEYLQSANLNLNRIRVYQIARNGKDWIVVTHGLYSSINEAREDAAIVEPNAWAKSVAVIQQQITNYQRSTAN